MRIVIFQELTSYEICPTSTGGVIDVRGLAYGTWLLTSIRSGKILHLHALLGAKNLRGLDWGHMRKLWKSNGQRNEKSGDLIDLIINGHAVIDPYDPKRGAKHYLTKAVHKGGYVDIFVPRKELEGQVPAAFETTA
jgi:hypothetical protein